MTPVWRIVLALLLVLAVTFILKMSSLDPIHSTVIWHSFIKPCLLADGLEPSDYVRRAIALDKHYGRRYFSLPTELMARAFEAAIESFTDIGNQYLVSGTTFSQLNDAGAYPDEAHRKVIFSALTNYFGMLGEALIRQSHRESNKKPNGS